MRGRALCAAVSTVVGTRTLVQILTGTSHPVKMTGWGISFEGVGNTDKPILVEVLKQTTAGTASPLTPANLTDDAVGLDTSAQETFSVEPTGTTVVDRKFIHPQSGMDYTFPDVGAWITKAGERVAVRYTVDTGQPTPKAVAYLEWEE